MNANWMHWIWVTAAVAVALGPPADAQEKGGRRQPQPQIVAAILKVDIEVEQSEPPNLVVNVAGQVRTGGYTKPRLVRAAYTTPPDDGIADYFLLAVPPGGPAIQVISEVKASDRWKAYTKEAPWIKGIRVHGVGEGIVVKMFEKK
jgi:hypothetical protein